MRAIKIDAELRTVSEIEIHGLNTMQQVVGGLICVAAELDGGHTLYVDDEGLLKENAHFFSYDNLHQPFAGNGLVAGIEHENGETVVATLSLEEVRRRVKFMSRAEVAKSVGVPEPGYAFYSMEE